MFNLQQLVCKCAVLTNNRVDLGNIRVGVSPPI
jgi:hypothetical protein